MSRTGGGRKPLSDLFGTFDRFEGIGDETPELIADVLRHRNALSQLDGCSCLLAQHVPLSPACRTRHVANSMAQAVDRLGCNLIPSDGTGLAREPGNGAELQQYLENLVPILSAITQVHREAGDSLEEWRRQLEPKAGALRAVTRKGRSSQARQTLARQVDQPPDRSKSMLRVIYALASEHYQYNPNNLRQKTARRIMDVTHKHNADVNEDTINKLLKEAAQLLSGDRD